MKRILLADPNPILRSALALLLETRLSAQIVGQVSSMESLLCEAAVTQPDLIIIGLALPGEPAQERIAALRQKAPRASLLISSTCPESVSQSKSTVAFFCQGDPPETILRIIRALMSNILQEEERQV